MGLFRKSGPKENDFPADKYFIVDEVAGRRIETQITALEASKLDREWFIYDGTILDGFGTPMIFYRYIGP